MLKDNKGITLLALVITIVVLIIIASVAAISGVSATHYIKYQNAKSQFQVIQSKIDSLYGEYSDIKDTTEKANWKNDTFAGTIKGSNFETELDSSIVNQTLNGLTIDSTNQDNYMYLSTDFIKNNLKVEGISYNFIVNLDEREVRLYGGVEYQNEMYYSAKNFGIDTIKFNGIGKWFYEKDTNGRKTIVTNKKLKLKIGDYINYNAAAKDAKGETIEEKTITSDGGSPTDIGIYKASEKTLAEGNGCGARIFSNKATTNGWRVLGVDEKTGELLIISADPVKTIKDADFYLRGIAGYNYGEKELNKVCSVFGSGYGATGARSVNVDDINKITGYNPNNVGKYDPEQSTIGTKFRKGESNEYGNKTTYSWTATANVVSWSGSNGDSGSGGSDADPNYSTNGFNWYDIENKTWKFSMQDTTTPAVITTLTSSVYYYYPNSLDISSGTGEGLNTESEEYKTLFMNKSGSKVSYWLASSFVATRLERASFGMRYVTSDGRVSYNYLYNSYGSVSSPSTGVRPVVSLKANIELEKQDDGSYNIK